MSNEFVVFLAIFVSALGGGACTLALALLKQNSQLKEELALSKENHRRNGDIAREYQVKCGELEEESDDRRMLMHHMEGDIKQMEARNAKLETSAKNGWKDAAEKWQETLELKRQIIDLKEKIEDLEAWTAHLNECRKKQECPCGDEGCRHCNPL